MTISILPILLGDGIRLFGTTNNNDIRLEVRDTKTYASGLVQIEYGIGIKSP